MVETGCPYWVLGAGCRCWCCELGVHMVELAVHVVETGCRDWVPGTGAGCWLPVLGAGAGCRELACRCSVLVPASDSEVITTAASDSEG